VEVHENYSIHQIQFQYSKEEDSMYSKEEDSTVKKEEVFQV
jgi:hypothetical protein